MATKTLILEPRPVRPSKIFNPAPFQWAKKTGMSMDIHNCVRTLVMDSITFQRPYFIQ